MQHSHKIKRKLVQLYEISDRNVFINNSHNVAFSTLVKFSLHGLKFTDL